MHMFSRSQFVPILRLNVRLVMLVKSKWVSHVETCPHTNSNQSSEFRSGCLLSAIAPEP